MFFFLSSFSCRNNLYWMVFHLVFVPLGARLFVHQCPNKDARYEMGMSYNKCCFDVNIPSIYSTIWFSDTWDPSNQIGFCLLEAFCSMTKWKMDNNYDDGYRVSLFPRMISAWRWRWLLVKVRGLWNRIPARSCLLCNQMEIIW